MSQKQKMSPSQEYALHRRATRLGASVMEWDRLRQQNQYPESPTGSWRFRHRSLHGILYKALLHERTLAQKVKR